MNNKQQGQIQEKSNNQATVHNTIEQDFKQSSMDNTTTQTDKSFKEDKKSQSNFNKQLVRTGLTLLGIFLVSLFNFSYIDSSDIAKQAIKNGSSSQLAIGTRILEDDEMINERDVTVKHNSSQETTKIHVWDYAAEDGDYVQVLVDGVAITEPFMIKNKPVVFTVPATGTVEVLGVRDGVGGISYAVHYEINGTTYLNTAGIDKKNIYTLIRE